MGEVTGFVGLKNDYCFALKSNENNDDISVIDDKDDDNNVNNISTSQRFIYPNLRIYNTSSTCQGPFSAEPIPVGCNSVPDPDTQGLSYEFSLKTGGQGKSTNAQLLS